MLTCFDIICLNEIKTPCNIVFSGYIAYRSKYVSGAASRRGGTIVFIKNYLANYVYNIDIGIVDQVWFQLHCVPGVMFGACYIPPSDSTYFNPQAFACLHEKMSDYNEDIEFLILGDMNARFGSSVRNIPLRSTTPEISLCTYPSIPDDIQSPNDNSVLLSSLCVDNKMLVVNNLQTPSHYFPSNKTYKKRNNWISELDTVVVSYKLINCINKFTVHQTDWLPSDHAPISIELQLPKINLEIMLSRASNLGGHGSLMGKVVQERLANRPIGYRQIDLSKFSNAIGSASTPEFNNNVNQMADNISNSLYNIVSSSRMSKPEHSDVSRSVAGDDAPLTSSRWDRLLQDPDDTRVWKALNWKGQLTFDGLYNETPTDIEFKSFYDAHITNQSQESQSDMINDINAVNVPILDSQIDPSEVIE